MNHTTMMLPRVMLFAFLAMAVLGMPEALRAHPFRHQRKEHTSCLLRDLDHRHFVDSAACQVKPSVGSGNHIAYHTAARGDFLPAEALRLGIKPDQRIRVDTRLAVPDFAVISDCDSVGF